MSLLAALFVTLVVTATTIWIALAIHYHVRPTWLRWFVSCVPLAVVGASLGTLPLVPWALAVWFGLLLIAIAWWFSLRPRSDRDWAVGMEVLPRVEIAGATLHVRQFRNFSYAASGGITTESGASYFRSVSRTVLVMIDRHLCNVGFPQVYPAGRDRKHRLHRHV